MPVYFFFSSSERVMRLGAGDARERRICRPTAINAATARISPAIRA
jgi:hypothetical protein